MNFFMEVAKLRAARLMWARLMQPFSPKRCRSENWPVAERNGEEVKR